VSIVPPAVLQPVPAPPVAPPAPAKPKAAKGQDFLERARAQLAAGDLAKAAKEYGNVIKRRYELDTVIEELRMAAEHFPRESALWQALGDAYMRDERTTEAIAAYQKGMDNV
jgi:tetratricopeptide (TPR) repeat protein